MAENKKVNITPKFTKIRKHIFNLSSLNELKLQIL